MTALATSPSGRRIIVSGAAGGIGRAIVEALAVGGNKLGVCDLVPTQLIFAGVDAVVAHATFDLRDPDATRAAMSALSDRLGGCDAIVANAGVVDTIHRAESFALESWQKDIATNLTGQFVSIQAVFPSLKKSDDARVIIVSSGAAESGLPGQAAYAASKAGLLGLAKTLAAEWAPHGIRCNVVLPGMIETPKVAALPPGLKAGLLRAIAIGRFGRTAELAGTIAFLLSPAAGYMTGELVHVDGGLRLSKGILGSDA
jgi:3-oxoacyl-[acyl-carrier protein] reductase